MQANEPSTGQPTVDIEAVVPLKIGVTLNSAASSASPENVGKVAVEEDTQSNATTVEPCAENTPAVDASNATENTVWF